MSRFGCTFVMGTGIVSIDLRESGWTALSIAVLVVAGLTWTVLALRGELAGQLAGVPATSVIGTRLTLLGWPAAGAVALVVAILLGLHRRRDFALPDEATGGDLLPVVALQSLVVLAGSLPPSWLRVPGAVVLGAGVLLYAVTIVRFRLAEITHGAGDQWIAGGALAISCLAAAKLDLHAVSVVLWVAALLWLPVLIAGEAVRPRRGDPVKRWATVFPIGMYAAMTFFVDEPGTRGGADIASACALAVWAVVVVSGGEFARAAEREQP
jgi:hypothetical protein